MKWATDDNNLLHIEFFHDEDNGLKKYFTFYYMSMSLLRYACFNLAFKNKDKVLVDRDHYYVLKQGVTLESIHQSVENKELLIKYFDCYSKDLKPSDYINTHQLSDLIFDLDNTIFYNLPDFGLGNKIPLMKVYLNTESKFGKSKMFYSEMRHKNEHKIVTKCNNKKRTYKYYNDKDTFVNGNLYIDSKYEPDKKLSDSSTINFLNTGKYEW
jgi:hypothetical protein